MTAVRAPSKRFQRPVAGAVARNIGLSATTRNPSLDSRRKLG